MFAQRKIDKYSFHIIFVFMASGISVLNISFELLLIVFPLAYISVKNIQSLFILDNASPYIS